MTMMQYPSLLVILHLLASQGVLADPVHPLDAGSDRHRSTVERSLNANWMMPSQGRQRLLQGFKGIEDYEITNDSNEVKCTVDILSHSFKMRPVPSSLTQDQLAKIKMNIEEILMEKLTPNVISVGLHNVKEDAWKQGQRMLRNGRYLADGASTDPASFLTIDRGEVNTTLSLYYDDPTEEDLNKLVEEIMVSDLLIELKKEDDFKQLTDIEIIYPAPIQDGEDLDRGRTPSTEGDSDDVSVGPVFYIVLAACIVALGAAIYARKRIYSEAEDNKEREIDDSDSWTDNSMEEDAPPVSNQGWFCF